MTYLGKSPYQGKRLKYVVELKRNRPRSGDERQYLGLENIESGSGRLLQAENEASASPSDSETPVTMSTTFEQGDVLFGKLRPYLAKTWVAEFDGCCTTELLVMRPLEVDARFLKYVCLTRSFVDAVDASTFGSKMPRADWDFIGSVQVPQPELPKQRVIADYLDRETALLDALVEAKERLLDLLAEKRRALITHAVMRGIDPKVRFRDSEISWLGEIPVAWPTVRVAWLFRERDERQEPDLPLLEVSINSGVVLREFSDDRIESTAADFGTYKVARRGDVVFNKMRMWQGAVGIAAEDGLVSPDYVVAEPFGEMGSDYAGLLFRTSIFSAECGSRSHGIVWDRLRLYWVGFRDIEVPVPSPETQSAIVRYVATETTRLDALTRETQRTIALLKERRAALITAAVAGDLDVSGSDSPGISGDD